MPPGVQDPAAAGRAAEHLLLGHRLATEAMRAQDASGGRFGHHVEPVAGQRGGRRRRPTSDAARRIDALLNRQFLDPRVHRRTPRCSTAWGSTTTCATSCGRASPAADRAVWVGSEDVEFVSRGLPRTDMGWEIDADGLYDVLTRVHRDYPSVPLYITENGAAFQGIADPQRIAYLDSHFRAAHRAIDDGVDLRGYFVWSLMDNFEWAFGYSKRFGLIHVDYETLQRTPKDSARWFAQVTRRNGLPD